MSIQALKPSDRTIEIVTKILLIALAAVLIVSAIITVFPFFWSALLSTRDRSEIFGTGISLAMGDSLSYNYQRLL
ncbi:carbohydrate ABC transporter permease, partial [Vibrio campbellii]